MVDVDVGSGEVLGEDFRLEEKIGQGGMGLVYRATQLSLERDVAVKILPRSMTSDDDFVARFQREARAGAALQHPNVVQVYAAGIDEGRPWFAMELVEGRDLGDRIRDGASWSYRRVAEIGRDAARALEAAFEADLIHRDIKSSNILVDEKDRVRVMDFGLARPSAGSHLTKTGTVMGTPHYMSPEQGKGEEVDIRSDLYSLGVVLYELLTGELPFDANASTAVIYKHVHEAPPPLAEVRPGVPDRLASIVERLLEKDPDDRYQEPSELAASLETFVRSGDHPGASTPPEAPTQVSTSDDDVPAAPTIQTPPPEAPSGAEDGPPSPTPRTGKGPWILAAVLLLALGGWVAYAWGPAPGWVEERLARPDAGPGSPDGPGGPTPGPSEGDDASGPDDAGPAEETDPAEETGEPTTDRSEDASGDDAGPAPDEGESEDASPTPTEEAEDAEPRSAHLTIRAPDGDLGGHLVLWRVDRPDLLPRVVPVPSDGTEVPPGTYRPSLRPGSDAVLADGAGLEPIELAPGSRRVLEIPLRPRPVRPVNDGWQVRGYEVSVDGDADGETLRTLLTRRALGGVLHAVVPPLTGRNPDRDEARRLAGQVPEDRLPELAGGLSFRDAEEGGPEETADDGRRLRRMVLDLDLSDEVLADLLVDEVQASVGWPSILVTAADEDPLAALAARRVRTGLGERGIRVIDRGAATDAAARRREAADLRGGGDALLALAEDPGVEIVLRIAVTSHARSVRDRFHLGAARVDLQARSTGTGAQVATAHGRVDPASSDHAPASRRDVAAPSAEEARSKAVEVAVARATPAFLRGLLVWMVGWRDGVIEVLGVEAGDARRLEAYVASIPSVRGDTVVAQHAADGRIRLGCRFEGRMAEVARALSGRVLPDGRTLQVEARGLDRLVIEAR